jgi:hypothetical protein
MVTIDLGGADPFALLQLSIDLPPFGVCHWALASNVPNPGYPWAFASGILRITLPIVAADADGFYRLSVVNPGVGGMTPLVVQAVSIKAGLVSLSAGLTLQPL